MFKYGRAVQIVCNKRAQYGPDPPLLAQFSQPQPTSSLLVLRSPNPLQTNLPEVPSPLDPSSTPNLSLHDDKIGSSGYSACTHRLLLLLGLGVQRDQIIDTQNRDRRLGRKLNHLDLGHGRLEHSRLDIVAHHPLHEIQTVLGQVRLALALVPQLCRVVVGTELGDQLGGVLGGVDREGLGDD